MHSAQIAPRMAVGLGGQGWWDTAQGAPLVRVSDPGLAFPDGRWLVLSDDGTRCASSLRLAMKPIPWVLSGSDLRDAL